MTTIIGADQTIFTFCDTPMQKLKETYAREFKHSTLDFNNSQEAEAKLVTLLKQTNKVCSPLFAAFVPVKPGRLSDVFLPLSTHTTIKKPLAILADLASLPVRLITFLPRVFSEVFRPNPEKLGHPIKYLAQTNDGFNPCLITSDRERFYFSLVPIHESEAKEYFDDQLAKLTRASFQHIQMYNKEYPTGLYNSTTDPDKTQFQQVLQRIQSAVTKTKTF